MALAWLVFVLMSTTGFTADWDWVVGALGIGTGVTVLVATVALDAAGALTFAVWVRFIIWRETGAAVAAATWLVRLAIVFFGVGAGVLLSLIALPELLAFAAGTAGSLVLGTVSMAGACCVVTVAGGASTACGGAC